MFLNYLKDFATKKIVKNNLSNAPLLPSDKRIETIGILFDESYFHELDLLVEQLVSNGIQKQNIGILVFKKVIRSGDAFDYPVFSQKDISWTAIITKKPVREFIDTKFDLLINYYDVEKSALLLVSHLSKAGFKAGFSSVDKRLNHFMIDISAGNQSAFSQELIKYLKILNKL